MESKEGKACFGLHMGRRTKAGVKAALGVFTWAIGQFTMTLTEKMRSSEK